MGGMIPQLLPRWTTMNQDDEQGVYCQVNALIVVENQRRLINPNLICTVNDHEVGVYEVLKADMRHTEYAAGHWTLDTRETRDAWTSTKLPFFTTDEQNVVMHSITERDT